jgi:transcriptional regulator with XRE-family HTH domain
MDGKKLAERMQKNGLTQAALAKKAGCTQQTVSYILNGKRQPRVEIARAIARALECKVDDLLIDPVEVV